MMLSPQHQDLPPLLFTVPAEQAHVTYAATPRHSTPSHSHRGEPSLSSRRSITPPGSVHTTDTTPPRPPPILRLSDALMAEAELPSAATPTPETSRAAALTGRPGSGLMHVESIPELRDTWVTVFGFGSDDLPLVLGEFQKCGDILQWGSFGASPSCNFIHIQYHSKYGAQRALQKAGEQLHSGLIIGVKPLDAKHKQLIDAYGGGEGGNVDSGGGMRAARLTPLATRPYKIESAGGQALPQPSRTLAQKVAEFLWGM